MSRVGAVALGAALTCVAGAVIGVPVVMSAGAMFGVGELTEGVTQVSCGSNAAATTVQVAKNPPKVGAFNPTQMGNAATIVKTGQEMGIPPRGWVIAIATAIQESQLHNLGHLGERNDHDSLGLFQQRPSSGWGTPAQVTDPVYASKKFYNALKDVPNWQKLPLTQAAQAVQRSAFPSAYAKWEDEASAIVDAITGGASKAAAAAPAAGTCAKLDQVTASGWVRPVEAPVGSGFRTAQRPDHQGVDLSARRGLPIRAAASGTVLHVECDTTKPGYDCNTDGYPGLIGCGWYADIRHADGIVSRYCHMLQRPSIKPGDKVTAGQQIGLLGTSGNSSGPHLHFEIHENNDRSSRGAINPVEFMKAKGAPLGEGQRGKNA